MRFISLAVGLMVEVATATTFKYALPANVKATADCTLPGEFEISNFTIYTDYVDNTKNTTSFHYIDVDTGIDTSCQQNSTSTSTSPGAAQRWPCDDANVEFIYQTTTGIAGLTLIEKACTDSSPALEASGLVQPELGCTNTTSSSTCTGKQSPLSGDFTSISPAPPSG